MHPLVRFIPLLCVLTACQSFLDAGDMARDSYDRTEDKFKEWSGKPSPDKGAPFHTIYCYRTVAQPDCYLYPVRGEEGRLTGVSRIRISPERAALLGGEPSRPVAFKPIPKKPKPFVPSPGAKPTAPKDPLEDFSLKIGDKTYRSEKLPDDQTLEEQELEGMQNMVRGSRDWLGKEVKEDSLQQQPVAKIPAQKAAGKTAPPAKKSVTPLPEPKADTPGDSPYPKSYPQDLGTFPETSR